MTTLWFKRKTYGYGWTPATKEGWWVIAIYALFVVASGAYFMSETPTPRDTIFFVLSVICSSVILIVICLKKGEIPRWQWGEPTDSDVTDAR